MVKIKHKMSDHQRMQIQHAQHKNDFFAKMKYVCDAFGGKGTFAMMPLKYQVILYQVRVHSTKAIAAKDSTLKASTIKKINLIYREISLYYKLDILPNNESISVKDFFSICLSLQYLLAVIKNKSELNEWVIPFVDRLVDFEAIDVILKAEEILSDIHCLLAVEFCDIQKRIIWFEHNLEFPTEKTGGSSILEIHCDKPKVQQIHSNNEIRSAWLLSWAIYSIGYKEVFIKLSYFKNDVSDEIEIPVFVQAHAFLRLYERIDCFNNSLLQLSLFEAFVFPKVIKTTENKALVEFRMMNQKFGYFLCEYVDNVILVRSFLFITNNGTPEGKKLYELTGLGKLDKKYLVIDKLSSFIHSDIAKNETLKSLFIAVGCENLLEINDIVVELCTQQNEHNIASLISEYLNKDGGSMDLFEDEED